MNKSLLVPLFLIFSFASYAQQPSWIEMMRDRSVNFYDVQKEFKKWKAEHEEELREMHHEAEDGEEGEDGSELYGRWAAMMEPRVYPTGVRPDPMQPMIAMDEYLKATRGKGIIPQTHTTGNWTPLGPVDYNGVNPASGIGLGRVNGMAVDPNNPDNIWLATPAGGLWNTYNGGLTWNTPTDNLPILSFSHVAFDPKNSNILYAASGDGEGTSYSIYGLGVLKSTDGGVTWNVTGLNWKNINTNFCHKIIVDSLNSNVVLVATTVGVYRTDDGGATWLNVLASNVYDVKFKPGDNQVVYAVTSGQLYKSTDNGLTFTAGPTIGSSRRLALAVTPANPNYVYILSCSTSNGFNGLWRSTDGGTTITNMSTSPNIMSSKYDGSGTGVQAWYDLVVAASPTDADAIFVGGVNIWKSNDGGSTWNIVTYGKDTLGTPYIHVDVHSIEFYNGAMYACTDGGFYKTVDSGLTWTDLSAGLQITQFYHVSSFAGDPNIVYGGAQDNGTDKFTGGPTWAHVYGKDGFRPFVDFTDSNVIYTSSQYGGLYRSLDAGQTFDSIRTGITGAGLWDTPFMMDPVDNKTLYSGFQDVFKSTDRGEHWTKISSKGTQVYFIAVAPSDPNTIYYGYTAGYWKTTDGGINWTSVTSGLPGTLVPQAACVSPTDPNKVWIVFSGYTAGSKVYASSDGGTTWTNYTGVLPNLPVNCITYQKGSNDGLYLGMDVGIFYRDSASANWQPFYTGLPNVMVRELDINYVNNKIRAATHGRGMWESDLFSVSAPKADFSASKTLVCLNDTVIFSDASSNTPDQRNWLFPGGSPSSSSSLNPSIVYSTPGIHDVSLHVSNSLGADSIVKAGYVTVGSAPIAIIPYSESFESIAFPDYDWVSSDVIGGNKWELTSTASFSGIKSVMLNNFNGNPPDEDYFITPSFNTIGVSGLSLTYRVAFAQKVNSLENKMAVQVSTDCGKTWNTRMSKTGPTLATTSITTGNFVPTSGEWRKDSVSLPSSYANKPNVKFKFSFTNKTGNNIYIDDINVSGIVGINEKDVEKRFIVSPNPFSSSLSVFCYDKYIKDAEITITDAVGKVVFMQTPNFAYDQPLIISTKSFSNGIYFISVRSRDFVDIQKVIKSE